MASETHESQGQHQQTEQPSSSTTTTTTTTSGNDPAPLEQQPKASSSTEEEEKEHHAPQQTNRTEQEEQHISEQQISPPQHPAIIDVVEKVIDQTTPQPIQQQQQEQQQQEQQQQQKPDQKVDTAIAEEKRQESPAKGNEAPPIVVNEKVIPVEKEHLSASEVKEEPKEMVKAEAKGEEKNADEKKAEEPTKQNGEGHKEDVVIRQKEVKFDIPDEIENKGIHVGSSSSREQTVLISDLKEYERKALLELKSKIEEAVLLNKFNNDQQPSDEQKEKSKMTDDKKEETNQADDEEKVKDETLTAEKERKGKEIMIDDAALHNQDVTHTTTPEDSKQMADIYLWGAPLMPSKGNGSTDVVLLKFLRAREFRVIDAFEMLKNTLRWRKENNIDAILNEKDDQIDHLDPVVYEDGHDREGHPICYNIYGMLGFDKAADKILGDEEKRERFLRWRIRKMERCVKEQLDFNPGGTSEILQINDLKNTPLPTRKEVRLATRRVVEVLQDNYPEFVYTNIFINVPLWYYAFNTVLSPFLTPRTKNKFITARTSRVTEILLKYIAGEQVPVRYGGLKMDSDPDFCIDDVAKEVWVKAGSIEIIEIPVPEVGKTMIWDVTVSSWEVSYKEEFVPSDERSYTIIIQKTKKINWQEGTIRNTFGNPEPGKILLTIDNGSFRKKRILYRYKVASASSS
ncbi:PATL4 [Linum perenne]